MRNFLRVDNFWIPRSSIHLVQFQYTREGGRGTCTRVWLNAVDIGTQVPLANNAPPAFIDGTGDPQTILAQLEAMDEPAARTDTARHAGSYQG